MGQLGRIDKLEESLQGALDGLGVRIPGLAEPETPAGPPPDDWADEARRHALALGARDLEPLLAAADLAAATGIDVGGVVAVVTPTGFGPGYHGRLHDQAVEVTLQCEHRADESDQSDAAARFATFCADYDTVPVDGLADEARLVDDPEDADQAVVVARRDDVAYWVHVAGPPRPESVRLARTVAALVAARV